MRDFLSSLQERALVCDGAMGTMLYEKGVFISRCFDELNLSNPDLVRAVHSDYVQAGADVIETNTFGANRTKLMTHGLAEQRRRINIEGARIAREAAGADVFVAGAVGPLGIRIEPWGKTGVDEARALFREQAEALETGGVDFYILETFSDLNEVRAAIQGVRDVSNKPIAAQMTIEEDGNSLEGTPPEIFARRLDEWGADVVGLNCSVGPQIMLDAVERIAGVTSKPLAVQPNAGKPRNVEGRNIYLCSPEYMASFTKKFVQFGVRLVGGCCGTTPRHIKAMQGVVRSAQPALRTITVSRPVADEPQVNAVPQAEKSRLARKLARGEFVKIVEMIPPRGHEYSEALERAKYLKAHDVDVIDVPEAPRSSARMSALSLALLLEKTTDIESLVHYACGDRNLLGMQADLLGAYALGLHNLLLLTGDPPKFGDYVDATAVYDVDSIGLTNMVRRLNAGVDVGGKSIGSPTGFLIGVGSNPSADDIEQELRRFRYKVEAGAEFTLTQPVFDVPALERFLGRIRDCSIPVIVSILPLASYKIALFLHHEAPGCSVPGPILDRMHAADTPAAARAEGIRIAQEILDQVKGMVQGVQIRGPFEEYETAIEVLSVVMGERRTA